MSEASSLRYEFSLNELIPPDKGGPWTARLDIQEIQFDQDSQLIMTLDALYEEHWIAELEILVTDYDEPGEIHIKKIHKEASEGPEQLTLLNDKYISVSLLNKSKLEAELEQKFDWGPYLSEESAGMMEAKYEAMEDR